jgi:hypothetical protein
MNQHAGALRELADVATRELVIEQAVSAVSASFGALRIQFRPETDSGIQGTGSWCSCTHLTYEHGSTHVFLAAQLK